MRVVLPAHLSLWALILPMSAPLGSCSRHAAPVDLPEVGANVPGVRAEGFPVEMRDELGRTVRVIAEPHRIVPLLPSHTETLFALGIGDRVVGVDNFSDYPDEVRNLPRVGGMDDPHLELIASLHPDLILASESSIASLERLGAPVWSANQRGLRETFRVIETIGTLVGRPAEADRLVEKIEHDLAETEREVVTRRAVSVYFELDENLYTVGSGSFVGNLIARAGGIDIVPASLGDFPKVSSEFIVASDPEVILGVSRDVVSRRAGWRGIRAVRTDQVFELTKGELQLITRPGPRIAESLRILARYLQRAAR